MLNRKSDKNGASVDENNGLYNNKFTRRKTNKQNRAVIFILCELGVYDNRLIIKTD